MCTKHPTYKAIRRPKKLKATNEVCPDCYEFWVSKTHVIVTLPTNKE